jgi:HEAT repeat protein
LLTHEKTPLRWQAADKLGKIGDARAVEPLVNTLMDENWLVRLHAVKALGRIGSPIVIEPLRRAELALRGMRHRKQGLGQWLMRFKNIC